MRPLKPQRPLRHAHRPSLGPQETAGSQGSSKQGAPGNLMNNVCPLLFKIMLYLPVGLLNSGLLAAL